MRTTAYAMMALMVLAGSVCAQTAASSETQLLGRRTSRISIYRQRGAVSEPPDLILGDLTAEAISPSAVDAQDKVGVW